MLLNDGGGEEEKDGGNRHRGCLYHERDYEDGHARTVYGDCVDSDGYDTDQYEPSKRTILCWAPCSQRRPSPTLSTRTQRKPNEQGHTQESPLSFLQSSRQNRNHNKNKSNVRKAHSRSVDDEDRSSSVIITSLDEWFLEGIDLCQGSAMQQQMSRDEHNGPFTVLTEDLTFEGDYHDDNHHDFTEESKENEQTDDPLDDDFEDVCHDDMTMPLQSSSRSLQRSRLGPGCLPTLPLQNLRWWAAAVATQQTPRTRNGNSLHGGSKSDCGDGRNDGGSESFPLTQLREGPSDSFDTVDDSMSDDKSDMGGELHPNDDDVYIGSAAHMTDNTKADIPIDIEDEPASVLAEHHRLLSRTDMQQLVHSLPLSVQLMRWERAFSIERDGDSFQAMLDRCSGFQQSLVVIETTAGKLLGGFSAAPWKSQAQQRNAFFGTGQSFVFSSCESHGTAQHGSDFVVFDWRGENTFCQMLDVNRGQMAMGGGGGNFGWIVEDNFTRGFTDPCDTFGNTALVSEGAFDIVGFEIYGFRSQGEVYAREHMQQQQQQRVSR